MRYWQAVWVTTLMLGVYIPSSAPHAQMEGSMNKQASQETREEAATEDMTKAREKEKTAAGTATTTSPAKEGDIPPDEDGSGRRQMREGSH